MTIKVRFVESRPDVPGGATLRKPPLESLFELELQALPKAGDVLHIHTDLLPAYYTKGGTERNDILINRAEDAGDYKDTVTITIVRPPRAEQDSVVHVIRPGLQFTEVLFFIRRYD